MREEQQFDCRNLEAALLEETPELLAGLERHAKSCEACREELRIWRGISAAGRTMHKEWPSPGLWHRIAADLETEAARTRGWRSWIAGLGMATGLRWQTAVATLALIIVSGTGAWIITHRANTGQPDDQHLLTDNAVKQVEQAEQAYVQSIDKLAKLAEPKLAAASTPLMMNYRDKLDLLDAAIADCRSNLDKNRGNAHMRAELLSFYQQKQQTLQEVLRED